MHNHSEAKCVQCGLTPHYHAVNSKAWEKDKDGHPVPTENPPHSFKFGGR